MALLILNQEGNRPEGTKKVIWSTYIINVYYSDHGLGLCSNYLVLQALSLLSRALEADPTSELLWIIYLLIFYSNAKSVGKDDMFSYAVCYYVNFFFVKD